MSSDISFEIVLIHGNSLSIFFIPYILLELPSNLLLKKFKRPSTYMGLLVVSWGTIITCTGLVTNFAGLCVTRVLLGVAEAGFFPGAVYIITRWYVPLDSHGNYQADICLGTPIASCRHGSRSSIVQVRSPARSLDSLPSPSQRWTALVESQAGRGFSCLKAWPRYSSAVPASLSCLILQRCPKNG